MPQRPLPASTSNQPLGGGGWHGSEVEVEGGVAGKLLGLGPQGGRGQHREADVGACLGDHLAPHGAQRPRTPRDLHSTMSTSF